jgi:hypothetical protein
VQFPGTVPTLEDKVLQRAVVMLLEPIYEQDFLDCSYGFRPGRSAHQALESFRAQMMDCRGGWTLEVDLRKFFDNLGHDHLRMFLQLRVRDGVLLRLIGKWLKAGVMEKGSVSYPEAGSPQGGVVAPPTILQTTSAFWIDWSPAAAFARGTARAGRGHNVLLARVLRTDSTSFPGGRHGASLKRGGLP